MNLDEIARLANVSRTTASRVINNHPLVSERTRRRVLDIIEAHSYQPNAAARALATNRSGAIGVVVPEDARALHHNPWFAEIVRGCSDRGRENDLALMLIMEAVNDSDRVDKLISNFVKTQRVDGFIVVNSMVDDVLTPCLRNLGVPVVVVGKPCTPDVPYVDANNREMTRILTAHLLSHGWKRPALINGPESMVVSKDRGAGFFDAILGSGIDPTRIPVISSHFTQPSISKQLVPLLSGNDAPDAVVATSDVLGAEVIRVATHLGLDVGRDIGVVAFDDLLYQSNEAWGLTTMIQPIYEMGREALRLASTPPAHQAGRALNTLFEGKLWTRRSCGCLKRDPEEGKPGTDADIDALPDMCMPL